jgi:ABC-type branched-subunit amino acid transport system substrate-binding protein
LTALLGTLCASGSAQILIGQTAGFTGTVAAGVKETTDGAKLYIDSINAKGGIGGLRIELISLDDKFDPAIALDNARKLIEERNVVAMFLTRGTPHSEIIIPLLDKYEVPLIAPSTGAMSLHQPVRKHVFNVRTTYQHEAERAMAHLATIGSNKIAIIYVDDTFGTDGLAGAQNGLAAAKLTPVAVEKFDRAKPDFAKAAAAVAKADPHAILILASSAAVADATKALRAVGNRSQIVTLSNNASAGFIKAMGEDARNVIVTQVFPRAISYGIYKEAQDLAREKNFPDVTPAMMEGVAAAKVLVEALKRTNGKPTREHLQAALEGLRKFDLGGMEVSFSPKDHTGLDYVDLSIVSSEGKFKR